MVASAPLLILAPVCVAMEGHCGYGRFVVIEQDHYCCLLPPYAIDSTDRVIDFESLIAVFPKCNNVKEIERKLFHFLRRNGRSQSLYQTVTPRDQ